MDVSVVCWEVEVHASGWSVVQRSPAECAVPVIVKPRQRGDSCLLGLSHHGEKNVALNLENNYEPSIKSIRYANYYLNWRSFLNPKAIMDTLYICCLQRRCFLAISFWKEENNFEHAVQFPSALKLLFDPHIVLKFGKQLCVHWVQSALEIIVRPVCHFEMWKMILNTLYNCCSLYRLLLKWI